MPLHALAFTHGLLLLDSLLGNCKAESQRGKPEGALKDDRRNGEVPAHSKFAAGAALGSLRMMRERDVMMMH